VGSLGHASHAAPAALPLDVPPPVHVPRYGVLLSSDACQSHSGVSWSHVYMLPIQRYAPVVHLSPASPPQPMLQSQRAPRDLQESRGACPQRDINSRSRAASVGAELIRSGWSSSTRKPPLFCLSAEPTDDPDLPPGLRIKIPSRHPNALNHIERYAPALGELADVPIRKNLTLGHSPARDR